MRSFKQYDVDLYKALTIKTAISNDIFKEEFYYYEIEWKPTNYLENGVTLKI